VTDETLGGNAQAELRSLVERIENLNELLGVAQSSIHTGDAEADLATFLQELSLVSDADQLPDGDDDAAVTMMTLHTAKGLEFPRVYLIGMEDNIFPHARALEDPGIVHAQVHRFQLAARRIERDVRDRHPGLGRDQRI
jgi:superfamily I DNA/RNA helicase